MKDNTAGKKKNKIYSNLGLKFLSVVLGFLVWLLVLNIDDSSVTRTISNIPVELVNTDAITSQNQLYTITSGDTVDIVIKGRKSLISDLDASDFKAEADMSKISLTNAVPITVAAATSDVEKKVSITVVDNVMLVELEAEKTVSVPVSVVTSGDVAEGYTLGNSVATPNLITIRGASSVVSSIDRAEVTVDVSGAKDDITTNCNPTFVNSDGEEISDQSLVYDEVAISVTVPVYKIKSVPINIGVTGTPAEGYVVADITYVPETANIGGETSVIKDITELTIDDVDISGCTEDVEITLDISKYLPEGVVAAKDSAYINVKVDVEKSVTRSISIEPSDITLKNKQSGYDYAVEISDESSVSVTGVSGVVSKITGKSLKLSLDASALAIGENTVTLELPESDEYEIEGSCVAVVTVTAQ